LTAHVGASTKQLTHLNCIPANRRLRRRDPKGLCHQRVAFQAPYCKGATAQLEGKRSETLAHPAGAWFGQRRLLAEGDDA